MRIHLFGMDIDAVSTVEAVRKTAAWCGIEGEECRYVLTPSLSHALLWQDHIAFRRAYTGASLVLADGMPLVAASKMFGKPLPEQIQGIDFTTRLFEALNKKGKGSCFLLGESSVAVEKAAEKIRIRWPGVRVAGTYSPPCGFENDPEENGRILEIISGEKPDLLIIGLGAPRQELWACRFQAEIQARVALCAGTAIDILAQEKPQAPLWMQKWGLEWLCRFSQKPAHLLCRSLNCAIRLPMLVWREGRRRGKS